MPYESLNDANTAADSSPAATESAPAEQTPKPIMPGSFPAPPSFMTHLNKPKVEQVPAAADASSASRVQAETVAEDASADPADYNPSAGNVDAADGIPDAEPSTVGGLSNDPSEDMPWDKDNRFRSDLENVKWLRANPQARQDLERLRKAEPFLPLVDDLTAKGFENYQALQAQIEEQNRQAEVQRQQEADAAYERQLQQAAEQRYVDEEDQRFFVQMQMQSRLDQREKEEYKRIAEDAKAHYEATLAQQAEQQKHDAYMQAVEANPILKSFAPDAQGKGIGQRTLEEAILSGRYSPAQILHIGQSLASDYKTAIDAAVAAAKAEAAKDLKKSANAPASLGTRGNAGGRAPATGEVIATQPNNGFRAPNVFTRWTDKRHLQ